MTHYYSKVQTSRFIPKKISARLRGKEFEFYTASGVFAIRKVDKGTDLLVNKCVVKKDWDILDLGCGYGVIGIVLAKLFEVRVLMTDVNQRAVKLTRMNAKLHGVDVDIREGDVYKPVMGKKFDTILMNPPYAAGRRICYWMIKGAQGYLKEGGLLQLVARHQKGGKMLKKKMEEVFGNVKEIAKSGGFRVYVSRN